jgi:hypothetical protein
MQCLMVREDAMCVVEGGDAMLDGEGGCNVCDEGSDIKNEKATTRRASDV